MVLEEDKGLLGVSDYPKRQRETDGLDAVSIRRSLLQKKLVEFAEKADVEVKWGHKLEVLQQDGSGVTVKFANGAEDRFSFAVGRG